MLVLVLQQFGQRCGSAVNTVASQLKGGPGFVCDNKVSAKISPLTADDQHPDFTFLKTSSFISDL